MPCPPPRSGCWPRNDEGLAPPTRWSRLGSNSRLETEIRPAAPELPARTRRQEDGAHHLKSGLLRTGLNPRRRDQPTPGKRALLLKRQARVERRALRFSGLLAINQRLIPKTRLIIIRNNHKWPNCVPVRTINQSPVCKHSIELSAVIVEATKQLQANHDESARRSVHNAARQVSRWILPSKCPISAEGFFAAGTTITACQSWGSPAQCWTVRCPNSEMCLFPHPKHAYSEPKSGETDSNAPICRALLGSVVARDEPVFAVDLGVSHFD
jgi:hypothetical protein